MTAVTWDRDLGQAFCVPWMTLTRIAGLFRRFYRVREEYRHRKGPPLWVPRAGIPSGTRAPTKADHRATFARRLRRYGHLAFH